MLQLESRQDGGLALSAADSLLCSADCSCSCAAFKLLTYVAWCFPWCSSIISPEMTGSRAVAGYGRSGSVCCRLVAVTADPRALQAPTNERRASIFYIQQSDVRYAHAHNRFRLDTAEPRLLDLAREAA